MEIKAEIEFSLHNVTKSYGALKVLNGISLDVGKNRIMAILGPSGCGKTTLLSLVAGSLQPDGGEIQGIENKNCSFLFQEPRLLDWLTVTQNVAFVLKDKLPAEEIYPKIESFLKKVGLFAYRNSYPRRLSGGQRQLVAMARALAYPSRILLMDEPFKSLDPALKLDLIQHFLRLWTVDPRTVLYVTHEIKEALLLADEICVLSPKPTVIRSRHLIQIPRSRRCFDDCSLQALEKQISGEFRRQDNPAEPTSRPLYSC